MPKEKLRVQEARKTVSDHSTEQVQDFQRTELKQNPVNAQKEQETGHHYELIRIMEDTGGLSDFDFQTTTMYRQHDAVMRENSKTKSKRHAAEREQEESDRIRYTEVNREGSRTVLNDPNQILFSAVVMQNSICMRNARKDVTGYARRNHVQAFQGKSYKKGKNGEQLPVEKARRAAASDADNLLNNFRKDIFLESNPEVPEELTLFTDAYHFTHLQGERCIREHIAQGKTLEGEPQAALKQKRRKLELFVLWQKQNCANFTAELIVKKRGVRACMLAMRHIESEGLDKDYNRLIHDELAHRLQTMQADYDAQVEFVRELSGDTTTTPEQRIAQLNLQRELAVLGRRLRTEELTDEEKAQIEEQGRQLIQNFDYEGNYHFSG